MKQTPNWMESDRKLVKLPRSSEERTSISFTERSRQVSFHTSVWFKKENKPVNKTMQLFHYLLQCSISQFYVRECVKLLSIIKHKTRVSKRVRVFFFLSKQSGHQCSYHSMKKKKTDIKGIVPSVKYFFPSLK